MSNKMWIVLISIPLWIQGPLAAIYSYWMMVQKPSAVRILFCFWTISAAVKWCDMVYQRAVKACAELEKETKVGIPSKSPQSND